MFFRRRSRRFRRFRRFRRSRRSRYFPPVTALATAFPSLRHRNFRLFLFGQFLSQIGTWIQTVAHGWLVLTLTGSPFLLGLVTMLGSLPILLFTLYGGVVADRVDKRRFILILQSGMLLEALALGVLTQFGWISVAWVISLAIFFGLLSAFEVPARQAFVMDLVGKEDLMNAIALNSSAFNVSRVIGPAIAGGIIAAAGLAACFYLNGLSFVAVIISLVAMQLGRWTPAAARVDVRAAMREGFDYVFGEPWPRTLVLLTATLSIFGFSFLTMLPVFARDVLGVGAGGYGGLLAAVGIGAAGAAFTMAAVGSRVRQGRVAIGAAGILGLMLVAIALLPWLWPAVVVCALAGGAMAAAGIATNTLLQRLSPDHLRGRVMGFYSFVALGMAPFGSLQAGWVAERFGVRVAFALGGLLCAAAAGTVVWRFDPRAMGRRAAGGAGVTVTPEGPEGPTGAEASVETQSQ
ncbi:MAG TPA: MFS transporter [Gemmatimonadales bacterium]|nr:MFS transporter [Gemmatimonadales bacterium]